MANLIWQVVAVLDESVSQGDLGDPCRRLGRRVLAQDEEDGLLEQRLRAHLPDDPAEEGCGGQDAHLRSVGVEGGEWLGGRWSHTGHSLERPIILWISQWEDDMLALKMIHIF